MHNGEETPPLCAQECFTVHLCVCERDKERERERERIRAHCMVLKLVIHFDVLLLLNNEREL